MADPIDERIERLTAELKAGLARTKLLLAERGRGEDDTEKFRELLRIAESRERKA